MMKNRRSVGLAVISATALLLTACSGAGANATQTSTGAATGSAGSGVQITINASGATSQLNAQQAWRDNYTLASGNTINYDGTGSGTGREQFIAGEVAFIGTDSALDADEITAATARCLDTEPLELPLYISPIAVAFNLPGIDSLNLDATTIAQIFDGKITKWNDPAIASLNESVELPDLAIIPVNRADDSGTTENFQGYLKEAAPDAWPYEPADVWPISGTQSAEKTSGVVNLVNSTEGAVTYADASQIGDLGTVAVEVAGEFLEYSPEAAAAIVDGSAPTQDATERRQTVELKRDGSIAGAYPIVLISYMVACTNYEDAATAGVVKDYLTYIASTEGQQAAAAANGGNAPISDALRAEVQAVIDQIGADS